VTANQASHTNRTIIAASWAKDTPGLCHGTPAPGSQSLFSKRWRNASGPGSQLQAVLDVGA
jgi:hypothetical protein